MRARFVCARAGGARRRLLCRRAYLSERRAGLAARRVVSAARPQLRFGGLVGSGRHGLQHVAIDLAQRVAGQFVDSSS